jgi:hypothetical protein
MLTYALMASSPQKVGCLLALKAKGNELNQKNRDKMTYHKTSINEPLSIVCWL